MITHIQKATSALDTEAEALVQEALNRLMKGRTSIIIAHRLTTIMDADKIVVIKRGKIREIGTHDELLQKPNGVYRKLAKRQILLDEASRYGSMEGSMESSMENLKRIETISELNFLSKKKLKD